MKDFVIEPQFLPSIEFFTRVPLANKIYLDLHHHYEKQTFRNRCYILGANKIERLTVPVVAGNHTPFKDVKISYQENWVKIFWRSIVSAYANAPFFIHYKDEINNLLNKKHDFLVDLNVELLTYCLKTLRLDVEIIFTEGFEKDFPTSIHDLRSVITPKQSHKTRPFYFPAEYPQLFGSNFEANLSIIDLIFCEGPNSQSIVTKSTLQE